MRKLAAEAGFGQRRGAGRRRRVLPDLRAAALTQRPSSPRSRAGTSTTCRSGPRSAGAGPAPDAPRPRLRSAARIRQLTADRARSAADPVVRARPDRPKASDSCWTSASSSSSARSARPASPISRASSMSACRSRIRCSYARRACWSSAGPGLAPTSLPPTSSRQWTSCCGRDSSTARSRSPLLSRTRPRLPALGHRPGRALPRQGRAARRRRRDRRYGRGQSATSPSGGGSPISPTRRWAARACAAYASASAGPAQECRPAGPDTRRPIR